MALFDFFTAYNLLKYLEFKKLGYRNKMYIRLLLFVVSCLIVAGGFWMAITTPDVSNYEYETESNIDYELR